MSKELHTARERLWEAIKDSGYRAEDAATVTVNAHDLRLVLGALVERDATFSKIAAAIHGATKP